MGRVSDFFSEQSIVLDGQKRAKMVALDRKVEEMETERDRLKTENQNLKAQVEPLKREAERLRDEKQRAVAKEDRLHEMAEKCLVAVANNDFPMEYIVDALSLSKAKGDHYFDILRQKRYVQLGSVDDQGHYYNATPEGRAYLMRHNLLD